ncbi:MAG: response regulator [Thermodesulfobacteriota bacterium]
MNESRTQCSETITRQNKKAPIHRQQQKLEAVGTLASGIAHEFNNILWIINGNVDLALQAITPGNAARYHLEQIEDACNRAKDLVTQLIGFTSQTEQHPEPLKIGIIVSEFLKLLRSSIPSSIQIQQHLSAKHDTVLADLSQIHQLLMNLCSNAAFSMRKTGGQLQVSLVNIELTDKDVTPYEHQKPGRYLVLSVTNTGSSNESSTHENRKALSVVFGIVKHHNGLINIQDLRNKGKSIHVFLPCLEEESVTSDELADETILKGKECILFIDDEPAIVDACERILERLGYEVEAFTNSENAVQLFQEKPGRFDLVITDMTMPDLNGVDVFAKLTAIRNDIPVILCTGYSDLISPNEAYSIGFKDFFYKPVNKQELMTVVRRVLDRKNPSG